MCLCFPEGAEQPLWVLSQPVKVHGSNEEPVSRHEEAETFPKSDSVAPEGKTAAQGAEWGHSHGVAKRQTAKGGSFTAVCLVLSTAANCHWARSEGPSEHLRNKKWRCRKKRKP